MGWSDAERQARQFDIEADDQRPRFARDRDRILYSSAFHRLAGITQIVRAGELDIFHTRQQHTYKVAQVGRRLAENVIRSQGTFADLGGVHPEVVEAACLAHDLGHPPFGHAAETELDKLVIEADDPDGFEGNAQTFRIITRLAVRFEDRAGLNLTRATLAATLKYPWLRDRSDSNKTEKWSAYACDREAFEWARSCYPGEKKTIEADMMDWADDIAYSVHDLEDFHRVGVIRWEEILAPSNRKPLIDAVVQRWHGAPSGAEERTAAALDRLADLLKLWPAVRNENYDGRREQRRQLRNLTSRLIGKYVRALNLIETAEGVAVKIGQASADEVRVLKQIARQYVIGLPALHAQQFGQKEVVRKLFDVFLNDSRNGSARFIPMRLRHIWHIPDTTPARAAADCLSSLTENEAFQLHRRLTGIETGSILDPVVR